MSRNVENFQIRQKFNRICCWFASLKNKKQKKKKKKTQRSGGSKISTKDFHDVKHSNDLDTRSKQS